MKKATIILAALGFFTCGYIAAEMVYQKKRKEVRTYPQMGTNKDFKRYQRVFMDIEGKISRPSYFRVYNRDSLIGSAIDTIETKKDEWKYRNAPRESSDNNILFGTFGGKDIGLSLNGMKSNRNLNVLTIGRNASDRENYIKANIMQENASALIVDPHGDLYRSLAPYLISKGHNVFLFSPDDTEHSNHYNPLLNVYDSNGNIQETQVSILVETFMKNVMEAGNGDPFHLSNAAMAFINAVIYYVLENDDIPMKDKCFGTVFQKVQMATADDDSPLTQEMNAWFEKMDREGKPYKTKMFYEAFLTTLKKKRYAIIAAAVIDLQIFANEEVDRITRLDEYYPEKNIDFHKIFCQQGYLFVTVPQNHKAYHILFSTLFTQFYMAGYQTGEKYCRGKYHIGYRKGLPVFDCFDSAEDAEAFCRDVSENNIIEREGKAYDLLWKSRSYKTCFIRKALETYIHDLDKMVVWSGDDFAKGAPALPVHVNVFLNDFANCGIIMNFLVILATSRSYRLGNHCLINSVEELKKMYQDEYECVLANVDSIVYFGSSHQPEADIRVVQKALGQKALGEFLMTPSEIDAIGSTETSKEIVSVRDCLSFVCEKCEPDKHKRAAAFEAARVFLGKLK